MIEYQHSTIHFSKNKTFSLTRYDHGSRLHFHSAVEFMFILNGKLEVSLSGKTVLAKAGDLVVINSSVLHSSKVISKPLDYYILIVSDEFLNNLSLYGEKTVFPSLIHSKTVGKIFNEIIAEWKNGDKFSTPIINGKIVELAVYINRNCLEVEKVTPIKDDKKTAMVKNALDYLKGNFKRKLTVDEIAMELAFSKSYLSHAFKEITGYTLISYLNLLKCQNARALILNGYSIKQASLECGFIDLSYFTRTYKKIMGELPSATK